MRTRNGLVLALLFLVSNGVDPNAPANEHGFRPLAIAARAGALDEMIALLGRGADPNLPDERGNHWVPLMHAVHKHRTAAVKLLLDHGANAAGPPGRALTPLDMAVGSGQTEVARLLLDRGADPYRRGPGNLSLLTLATAGGALTDIDEPLLGQCHPEMIALLKERAPALTIDMGLRGHVAMFFAWLNGCR